MGIILFDTKFSNFLPLTFTKPVSELRIGILTNTERWKKMSTESISYFSQNYLSEKFPTKITENNIFVASHIIPSTEFVSMVCELKKNHAIIYNNQTIAYACDKEKALKLIGANLSTSLTDTLFGKIENKTEITNVTAEINVLSDLFTKNKEVLLFDYLLVTKDRETTLPSNTNKLLGTNIFIEEGATVECSFLNSKDGPIYIGKNAEVMEGAMIRGGFSLGEGSTVKMGAKVYGATTIGPHCKIGGEISNSILFGFTNKGHDGFLGNSILGEWCNLGADTNSSNLKNNYGNIKIWSYDKNNFIDTKLQFHGLIMGDHSKCGINTMFNTGTIVGVSSNIYGGNFLPKFIPSFAWGDETKMITYDFDKACETAIAVMARRGIDFTVSDKKILEAIFISEAKNRNN
jgi:UDP-N-acetylglucosamine diphosphorylase/glucosamine-1-phosphate N-acetyltransferase